MRNAESGEGQKLTASVLLEACCPRVYLSLCVNSRKITNVLQKVYQSVPGGAQKRRNNPGYATHTRALTCSRELPQRTRDFDVFSQDAVGGKGNSPGTAFRKK